MNLWSKLVASCITESKFTLTSQTDFICSKQYAKQSEYYYDAIKRSFEEKLLFEFPIVTLTASLEHKIYSELQNLGFNAKQRTTDAWISSEVTTLCCAIYDIQSGCIITLVSKRKFTLTIQAEDIPLFISEHIFFGSKTASQIQWMVTQLIR